MAKRHRLLTQRVERVAVTRMQDRAKRRLSRNMDNVFGIGRESTEFIGAIHAGKTRGHPPQDIDIGGRDPLPGLTQCPYSTMHLCLSTPPNDS